MGLAIRGAYADFFAQAAVLAVTACPVRTLPRPSSGARLDGRHQHWPARVWSRNAATSRPYAPDREKWCLCLGVFIANARKTAPAAILPKDDARWK